MNDNENKSSRFWSWVGKAAVLVGLVYGVIQVVNAVFPTGEYEIVAYGDCAQLAFPDSFYQEIRDLSNSIDADRIAEFLPPAVEDTDEEWYNLLPLARWWDYPRSTLALTVTNYMRDNFPSTLEAELNRLRSIWWFVIRNEGTREVNDLTLELPFDGLFRIERSGGVPVFSDFQQIIQIGSLRPSQEIVVTVWSEERLSWSDQPVSDSWWLQSIRNETRITHPNGVIDITYHERVTGVLAWLARTTGFRGNFLGLLIVSFVLLGILALGIYGAYQGVKEALKEAPSKEQASETPSSEEEPSGA